MADAPQQTTDPSRRPGRQHGRLRSIAVVVVAALAAAALYLALEPRPPALTHADRTAIAVAIEAKWIAQGQVLPRRYARAHVAIPQTVLDAVQARYVSTLRAVVTPEFLANPYAVLDFRILLPKWRNAGVFPLKDDFRVMSVRPERRLGNGDLVVSSGEWGVGRSGIATVDETPVWEYQMRKVAGRWRIVAEHLMFDSEDDSPAYGPDTKHWVDSQKLTKGDQGLYLGSPSPEPAPSA